MRGLRAGLQKLPKHVSVCPGLSSPARTRLQQADLHWSRMQMEWTSPTGRCKNILNKLSVNKL